MVIPAAAFIEGPRTHDRTSHRHSWYGAEVAGSLNDDRFRRAIEAKRIAGDIASSLVASSSENAIRV